MEPIRHDHGAGSLAHESEIRIERGEKRVAIGRHDKSFNTVHMY